MSSASTRLRARSTKLIEITLDGGDRRDVIAFGVLASG